MPRGKKSADNVSINLVPTAPKKRGGGRPKKANAGTAPIVQQRTVSNVSDRVVEKPSIDTSDLVSELTALKLMKDTGIVADINKVNNRFVALTKAAAAFAVPENTSYLEARYGTGSRAIAALADDFQRQILDLEREVILKDLFAGAAWNDKTGGKTVALFKNA